MFNKIIFLIALQAFATARVTYDDYKVYRIMCSTPEQVQLVKKLGDSDGYSIWREPEVATRTADLMVSPGKTAEFTSLANDAKAKFEVLIENVQKLIDQENPKPLSSGFGWTQYHTLDEIYNWLDTIHAKYHDNVTIINLRKTYHNVTIKGVKLYFGGQKKPAVFLEGGIHAREWISPATVTYIINELLTSNNTEIRKLADKYDWYAFPSVNPDGYIHSHKVDRNWRKNLAPQRGSNCSGVDLNRNWDWGWGDFDLETNPCSHQYVGSQPFSEIETTSLSEYLKSIKNDLFAYISFHSFSQMILIPSGPNSTVPRDYEEMIYIANKAANALSKRYRTTYLTGTVSELQRRTSGVSTDWVKGKLKKPIVFTYELRDVGKYGYLLPAEQIVPSCQEVMDSLVALFNASNTMGYTIRGMPVQVRLRWEY